MKREYIDLDGKKHEINEIELVKKTEKLVGGYVNIKTMDYYDDIFENIEVTIGITVKYTQFPIMKFKEFLEYLDLPKDTYFTVEHPKEYNTTFKFQFSVKEVHTNI